MAASQEENITAHPAPLSASVGQELGIAWSMSALGLVRSGLSQVIGTLPVVRRESATALQAGLQSIPASSHHAVVQAVTVEGVISENRKLK